MSKRKRSKTCKEAEDGRLFHLRDDGRLKLLNRHKALAWAHKHAPKAVDRIAAAYDTAEKNEANAKTLEAEKQITKKKKAAATLRAANWVENEDGSFYLILGGKAVAQTDPESAAKFVDRFGPEAFRRKLLELGRGEK